MIDINQINLYLESEEFDALYDYLNQKVKIDTNNNLENMEYFYHLGMLFSNFRYKLKNNKRASSYFKKALEYDNVNPGIYIAMSKVEEDRNTLEKYLHEGHLQHPKNPLILSKLCMISNDFSKYTEKLLKTEISNSDDMFLVLEALNFHKLYNEMDYIITENSNKLKYYQSSLLFLFFLIPFIGLHIDKPFQIVKKQFEFCISKDKDNDLQYIPYIYAALEEYKQLNYNETISLLKMIPIAETVSIVFDGPFLPFNLDIKDEVFGFLNTLCLHYQNEEEIITFINALVSIVKINPTYMDPFEFTLEDAENLKSYFYTHQDNTYVASTAIEMYNIKSKYIESVKLSIYVLRLGKDLEDNMIFIESTLNQMSISDLKRTVKIIKKELTLFFTTDDWQFDNILQIVDPVISAIYNLETSDNALL